MNQTTSVATVVDALDRKVEFLPIGGTSPITLSLSIVKRYFTQKTKQGYEANEAECMKFVMLCKARALNPWEGDAYLQGYDSQDGPKFSLITAHQAFLKRAELNRNFNGMESGVVVLNADDEVEQYEGDLVLPGHELIGGWAKVHVKDRPRPYYKRLKLETFNTGRSRWQKDPAGMIVKCAEADSLRTAYPTSLGGLYNGEEQETVINVESVEPKQVADAPAHKPPGQRRKQETIAMPASAEQPTTVVFDGNHQPIPTPPLFTLKASLEQSGIPYTYVQELMSQGDLIKGCTEIPIEALTEEQIVSIDKHWRMILKEWNKAQKQAKA